MSAEEKFEKTIGRLEKLVQAQRWIIGLTAAAVLWGARLEYASTDHGKRLDAMEPQLRANSTSIAQIEGRLHGISTLIGRVPEKVVAKINEKDAGD